MEKNPIEPHLPAGHCGIVHVPVFVVNVPNPVFCVDLQLPDIGMDKLTYQ